MSVIAKRVQKDTMAKDGPAHYTRAMLHKAFTGEPSEYAHSEARRHHMSIADFMARYDQAGAPREPRKKKARGRRKSNAQRDV